jgi:hypothetical protein
LVIDSEHGVETVVAWCLSKRLDGSPHDWLEGRGPRLTALGRQDDSTGKILAAQFFPSETTLGYLCLLRQLLRRFGVPVALYGDHSAIFVRNDDCWTVEERICCFVHERIVSSDNVMQWEGRRFQIPQQARRFSFAGARVQICQALDGRAAFYYGDPAWSTQPY